MTVGPATSAEFNVPIELASDAVGDLYIVDLGNCLIREVTAATGIITTVAGRAQGAGTYNNEQFW